MNQSTNYNFNLPEGTDLVNLLTQLIPNWSSLDGILKGVENQAFTNCTEVTSLGVHAISRSNSEGKILKWIATANFTAGETFTVDGNVKRAVEMDYVLDDLKQIKAKAEKYGIML